MGNLEMRAYCLGCRTRVEVAAPLERIRWGVVSGKTRWVLYRARCGACGGGLSVIRQERACPPHHFKVSQDGREGRCVRCGETRDYTELHKRARKQVEMAAKKRGMGAIGILYG